MNGKVRGPNTCREVEPCREPDGRWPTRLINIASGKVECLGHFANSDDQPRYTIGSYIWSPEELPQYPRWERRTSSIPDQEGRDLSSDEWEYCTQDFDAVIQMVKEADRKVRQMQVLPHYWLIDIDDGRVCYEDLYPLPDLGCVEMGLGIISKKSITSLLLRRISWAFNIFGSIRYV